MGSDLPCLASYAATLLSAFDWRRQPAIRNISLFSSKWPKDGLRLPSTQLVKVASTVSPCSENDESSTHYRRNMRLGSGAAPRRLWRCMAASSAAQKEEMLEKEGPETSPITILVRSGGRRRRPRNSLRSAAGRRRRPRQLRRQPDSQKGGARLHSGARLRRARVG